MCESSPQQALMLPRRKAWRTAAPRLPLSGQNPSRFSWIGADPMTDARLPERWLNDRRIVRLTDGAFRTFTTSLLWSVANRTDGVIDTDDLDLVHGASSRHVPELVTAGLYAPPGAVHLIADFSATPTSRGELLLFGNKPPPQTG